MNLLHEYKNGNCRVQIFDDGTKIRETDDDVFKPTSPESMDVKITNRCSLENHCKWCHEGSTKDGEHANMVGLLSVFDGLSSGVEIAIGGGNPLAYPSIIMFLIELRYRGLIANITVNELHLPEYAGMIKHLVSERLIHGIGITYLGTYPKERAELDSLSSNVVYHFIAGVHNVDDILKVRKALVLGYKRIRKGEGFFSDKVMENLYQWYTKIPMCFGKVSVSFDNLALKQLNIKRFLDDNTWNQFYMGDDGQFTFYIDGVKREYAASSVSPDRYPIGKRTAIEMFQEVVNNGNK